MLKITLNDAKLMLIDLLNRWESGELNSPWELVDSSEEIEDALFESGQISSDSITGLEGLIVIALDVMANAHFQDVLPIDIPAIRSLLEANVTQENQAIKSFIEYWEKVDMEKRKSAVKKYWGF